MLYAIWIGLFMPLVGFLTLVASANKIGRRLTGLIGCGSILTSFICFSGLLYAYTHYDMLPFNETLFTWIPDESINADFTLRIDPLSLLMTLIITGVGFLIHVYSIGYMDHEESYVRYFAFMNFFIFAMLLLVLAAHLLLLFVGWEGVGLASYLLIGFYYERPSAAQAATKAFVINRIGDFGFLVGLLLTFTLFGTGDIAEVSVRAGTMFSLGAPILTLMTLLYFMGATGKSAQLPLYTWLPDAMEGPTPVSALIHAATMVTAGVYLVVRMHPVFMMAPTTLHIVGAIGGITSLFAAICALGQTDLKRVLAFSTISQLGLMFLACGIGAFYAAMFHLTTHAFMKSLLFLSAGNIVHMMHGETEMAKMGGLSKIFTKTHWLFLIGVLALSGVPPLAAFFSKDLILEQEYLAGFETLFIVGLTASILTAFYMTRAYCLTFLGPSHVDEKTRKSLHEAPRIMIVPVSILAVLAIIGGFLGCHFCHTDVLEGFLAEVGVILPEAEPPGGMLMQPETWMSIIGGVLGIGAAALIYTRYRDRVGQTIQLLKNQFYVNEIYWYVFAKPLIAFANFIAYLLEPKVFDGLIRVSAKGTQFVARELQRFQSGQIRSYVAWMAAGMALLIVYFVL